MPGQKPVRGISGIREKEKKGQRKQKEKKTKKRKKESAFSLPLSSLFLKLAQDRRISTQRSACAEPRDKCCSGLSRLPPRAQRPDKPARAFEVLSRPCGPFSGQLGPECTEIWQLRATIPQPCHPSLHDAYSGQQAGGQPPSEWRGCSYLRRGGLQRRPGWTLRGLRRSDFAQQI